MVVLNVALWLQGSRVPSYKSKVGILNLEGKRWLVMDAMKGESVLWTRSSTWFALLIESFISSMVLFIWSISLSKCGTLRVIVPLNWSPLALFSAFSFSKFWPHSPPCRCWRCLLTSLINYWFYCISSAIVVAMDCNCCRTVMGGWWCIIWVTGGISILLVSWTSGYWPSPNNVVFLSWKAKS